MKKIFSILLIFILLFATIFFLTGCVKSSAMNSFERAKIQEAYRTKLFAEMEDRTLVTTLLSEANLIGESLDEHRPMTVVMLVCNDGDFNTVECANNLQINYSTDDLRRLAAANLAIGVAESEYVSKMHQAGKNVEILGAIIEWTHHDFLGNKIYYSAVDANNDGVWDFVSHDNLFLKTHFMSAGAETNSLVTYHDGSSMVVDTDAVLVGASEASRLSELEALL